MTAPRPLSRAPPGNPLAPTRNAAIVGGPIKAKAPVLKHRGPLVFTDGAEPTAKVRVRLLGRIFAEANPERKGFA